MKARRAGRARRPCPARSSLVSANAGATSTGAVDPLPGLADLCQEQDIWLHVDAAYGGFAVLSERGRDLLHGIERADSVTLDPHKWLYQPIESGALLVREPGALERAFSVRPDYLADTEAGRSEVNFAERGLQLTRTCRALKIWLSVRTFGIAAFRDAVDRCFDLAALAERLVREDQRLELMMPATLGIVCFRRSAPNGAAEDELAAMNASLVASLAASGKAMVSSTRLRGRYGVRLCVLNHGSTGEDVRAVVEHFASGSGAPTPPAAVLDVERVPARAPQPPGGERGELAAHPVAAALSHRGQDFLARSGTPLSLPAGEVVVRRWGPDRDVFLVLDGRLIVDVDGVVVRELASGDFFGELAARDWGSGFGYPRLATVTSRTAVRLWQVPPEVFRALLGTEPSLAAAVERAVQERLPLS